MNKKIVVFKTLVISKLVFVALLTIVPSHFIYEIVKQEKDCSTIIRHETLKMDSHVGGLKHTEIRMKVVSLQYSWIKNYTITVIINGG